MATKLAPGTEVRYCHEGEDRRAQVAEVHPETGAVVGINVYDAGGCITHGVQDPVPATTPQHRITHGHFWAQK